MTESKKQIELSNLTDQELLLEAKKMKTRSITNAVLIGFLIGVLVYGAVNDTLGFLAIIPLFIIYKLANNSPYGQKEIENRIKERNLK